MCVYIYKYRVCMCVYIYIYIYCYCYFIWWSPFIPSKNLDEDFTNNHIWL